MGLITNLVDTNKQLLWVYLECKGARYPMSNPLPRPSRIILNAGIIIGGLVGLILSLLKESNDIQAFIVTGICCLIGAGIFSYGEVIFRRYQQPKR